MHPFSSTTVMTGGQSLDFGNIVAEKNGGKNGYFDSDYVCTNSHLWRKIIIALVFNQIDIFSPSA
jgi:hypothetical protein